MIRPVRSFARNAVSTSVRTMQSGGGESGVSIKVSAPVAMAASARSDGSNSVAVRMNTSNSARITTEALPANVASRWARQPPVLRLTCGRHDSLE